MSAVALEHVTLQLGGRAVLSDVSFEIQAGEFIGVLGPNGAGKTTLMRAILGLLTPSAGRVKVFGQHAGMRKSGDRISSATAHSIAGSSRSRPRFHCRLPERRALGAALSSRHDRLMVEETLEAVGAHELANRPLAEMSGGERQRLLLAQALIGSPRLLLLDEPLISLDARRQEIAIDVVRRVCRERKITVLFSAHELNQLLGTLDRVLYLGNGHAVLGSVEEVVTAPVLSRLFGTEIQVLRADGHIFVMSRGLDVERTDHLHDHGHEHGHHHHH